jgi:Carbon-nitrogen hydrolase
MNIFSHKKIVLLAGLAVSYTCICKANNMQKQKIYSPMIAVVSLDSAKFHDDSMAQRMRRITKFIADAALDKPDLILLPESCLSGLGKLKNVQSFIKRDDKYFNKFKELSKKYKIYISAAVLFANNNKTYNSVLLFNPLGKLEYIYNKSYLTPSELAAGLTPGSPLQKCWDAPWGKTAFAICYDLNFAKLFENYHKQNVQLLLFPSYFPGGMVLKQRALFMRAFAASSHGQGFESVFVDRVGREFARANMLDPVITRKINLNSAVVRFEPAKFRKIKNKFGKAVEIEVCRPEGFAVISVPDLKVDVQDIMREYQLMDLDAWYKKSEDANDAKRK